MKTFSQFSEESEMALKRQELIQKEKERRADRAQSHRDMVQRRQERDMEREQIKQEIKRELSDER